MKGRRCEFNGRYYGSPIVVQWSNIVTSDWKFTGSSHSLEYVLALLPKVLRDNIWKVKPLHEEVSLLNKFYGGGSVGNDPAGFRKQVDGE